jgi:uncharacterized protein YciI
MKYLIFSLIVIVASAGSLSAQSVDSLYIVTYTVGSLWDQNKNPQDQPYFADHSAHLSKLRKDGVIKMGGRYSDKGIIVIQVASMKVAEEAIKSDHAIENHLFDVNIDKLNVFYEGLVERPKPKEGN